jgi:predicted neuraminidase
LLTAWYNGTGEREADDVKILGSRWNKSTGKWTSPFLLADTPGYPDCNPALFAAPDKTLWMFWPTILDHRWEGALLKFAMTDTPPDGSGPAAWKREGVLHVTPTGFDRAMADALKTLNGAQLTLAHSYFEKLEERSKDELYQRLGWMPRVHPTVLPSGRWLLPLYSDTFSASIVAISDDQGNSWTASRPIIGFGNIQPSIVRKNDGTLVAYMRENGPRMRIRVSTSSDEGMTWSPVTDSTLPNPGAGIEALRLADGHWAIIYNDTMRGRHSLAVSLSDDEGMTWSVTRHVATGTVGDEQFHYPSIIQSADGLIHATFTNSGKTKGSTIDHAVFDEAWIREGDRGEK